ncbi:hypothetical protein BGZ68_001988, partial [Mortierella alpina]
SPKNNKRIMHQVWSILLLVIALAFGATEGSPQNSCKDLADFNQKSNLLPDAPDEHGKVIEVKGSAAKKMFPGLASKITSSKTYVFVAYFSRCVREPMYTQLRVKSGPYTQSKTSKLSYNMGLELGFDISLSEIWQYLPKVKANAGIARGVEKETVDGVSISEGEIKQECLVVPGWKCHAVIRLDEKNSGKVIVDDKIRTPTFFPASLNGKNLYSDVWLKMPEE